MCDKQITYKKHAHFSQDSIQAKGDDEIEDEECHINVHSVFQTP